MSKAEKFISEHTKNCSNEYLSDSRPDGLGGFISRRNFQPWLTPDNARRAVEIAREEMIDWIEDNIGEYCYGDYLEFSAVHIENIDLFDQESFISDLRKAIKDE